MHRLLLRQLRKLGLDPDGVPEVGPWQEFLRRVDRSYVESDEGRYLLERSLMLTSQEMQGLYESLHMASETRIAVERDKLRAVLASLSDGLCILNGEGRVISLNPAGEAIVGQHARECVGQHVDELVSLRGADGTLSIDELIRANEVLHTDDGLVVRTDGRRVATAITFTPIQRDAPSNGAVLVTRDVSEQRAARDREAGLRAELERSRRLESLGVLAGGIAHDLNNILGPVVAYPDLFREELPPESPLLADVAEIDEAVHRALGVIGDLLTLARVRGGRLTRVEVGTCLRRFVRSDGWTDFTAREPEVELSVEIDADGAWVEATAGHLTRTLLTLARHAARAMGGVGRVEARVGRRHLNASLEGYERVPPGDYVMFSVADQGPSLQPADLHRLFEPFYAKHALGHAGPGLGLAVVYALTRDCGALLDVQTSPTGTRFDVYFPAVNPPDRSRDPRPSRGNGELVLVVDDVPAQRALARRLLISLGYRVETARNGRDAVEFIAAQPVDLVLLDMVMEDDFDGCDTVRAMRRLRPAQRCLLVSGFEATGRIRDALALGAVGYLRKPYARESVASAVRAALNS